MGTEKSEDESGDADGGGGGATTGSSNGLSESAEDILDETPVWRRDVQERTSGTWEGASGRNHFEDLDLDEETDVQRSPDPKQAGKMSEQQAEQRYGREFDRHTEIAQLQQKEQTHGSHKVQRWLEEGMPTEAMGTPSKMHAFRKRKGTPVPWNVEQHNEESLQRSTQTAEDTSPAGETQVPDSVRDVISSPGQSLDADIQRTMEDEMGDSFSDVQIHTGPRAAQACDDINAKAFTVGNNIAFNQGEYDPTSAEGQHTIAHELAHVRQQTGGAVSMLPQENLDLEIDPDPELEQEAEETAQRVMQGGELGIQRMGDTEIHIQRSPKENSEQILSAERDGKTKTLNQGTKSKGWKHIKGRHIDGTLDKNKRTSFFPTGQSIKRAGSSVTLDSEMSEAQVKNSIKKAIKKEKKIQMIQLMSIS